MEIPARLRRIGRDCIRTDDAVNATDASFTDLTAMQEHRAPNQTLNYCGDPASAPNAGTTTSFIRLRENRMSCTWAALSATPITASETTAAHLSAHGCRVYVHRYDVGRDHESDSARQLLSAESDRAEWNASRQSRHRGNPWHGSAIFGVDGGMVRSSGAFANISSQCTARGLTGTNLATCQQLLRPFQRTSYSLNKGLSTLQFQSLSVAADQL